MSAQAASPIGIVLYDDDRDIIVSALLLYRDRRPPVSEDWGEFYRKKGRARDLISTLLSAA